MSASESYVPPSGVSLRSVRKQERARSHELHDWSERRREKTVASMMAKLAVVNAEPALRSQYEIVYPLTRLGRLLRPRQQDLMIPAITKHVDGKSTMGGWMNYWRVTGHYLLIETAIGYPLPADTITASERGSHVILDNGRLGRLLPPGGSGNYPYRNEGVVSLERREDQFEVRSTEAIWGPSITSPNELFESTAHNITEALDLLVVGHQELSL